MTDEAKQSIEISRFQILAGTTIGGKIFLDYAEALAIIIDTKKKGEQTKLNRLIEATAKVNKLVQLVDAEIVQAFGTIGPTESVVDYLTKVINEVLMLNQNNQKRVLGLMQKLNREQNK